jgi:uncharacterized protein YecE (DUF72 family)
MSRTSSRSGRPSDPPDAHRGTAHVGCSGWHYKHWRGRVYDESLPPGAWLREYARRFHTVEINNSFYRLPSEQTFAAWREQVPRGFRFAVKASRFLTHIQRLREPEEPLARFFERAQALGPTLGPVLYQLPPRWIPDEERFRLFLEALPRRLQTGRQPLLHVVEFRDQKGYTPWVFDLLREQDVSLCVHDMRGSESPLLVTGPIAYVRLHGYDSKYGGSYPDEVLAAWAEWIASVTARGTEVFVYFNNDVDGHAVNDATRLSAMLARRVPERHASGRAVAAR